MNPAQGRVPARRLEARLGPGLVLNGRAWCNDRPLALVAITHGLGEHSGRYAALADALVGAGCTVVSLDLPGHGDTAGPRGDIPSWISVRDRAIPAMFNAAAGLPGDPRGAPRVLLGHSMGGLLALDFALAHPDMLAAVIASAPAFRGTIPPWWKLALANLARVTTPSAGFPHGLDESGMSRDAEVLKGRATDPLVHDRISPRLYFDLSEARQRVMLHARRLQVPCLVQQGAADRVVFPEGAKEFVEAAGSMAKLILYPDAYHEIYNDPARDQAIPDLLRWLDGALGRDARAQGTRGR
jgi:alpha-beta hydrolase superfamily lysophospholipase